MNFIHQNYSNSKDAANAYYSRDTEFDAYVEEQLEHRDTTSASGAGSRIARGYVTLDNAQDMNDSFDLFKEHNHSYKDYCREATTNIHTDSPLAQLYFSKANVDLVQDMIRYQVYEQSNKQHVISRQSDTELQVIMRHFYLTYGKNQPDNLTKQVAELNTYVVNECVPIILSSVEQYLAYRIRITQNPVPLEHAQNPQVHKVQNQLQPNIWL
jgi:hypothetical protein